MENLITVSEAKHRYWEEIIRSINTMQRDERDGNGMTKAKLKEWAKSQGWHNLLLWYAACSKCMRLRVNYYWNSVCGNRTFCDGLVKPAAIC